MDVKSPCAFERVEPNKFRGQSGIFRVLGGGEWSAKIFDNLIGCTNNFVSIRAEGESLKRGFKLNFGFNRGDNHLTASNESLIPAQNQRWRRA